MKTSCPTTLDQARVARIADLEHEVDRLQAALAEAWKLVNAMAGCEYWERAEEWLAKHREEFGPNVKGEAQPLAQNL